MLTGSKYATGSDVHGHGNGVCTVTFNNLTLSANGSTWIVSSGDVSITVGIDCGDGGYQTTTFTPTITVQWSVEIMLLIQLAK